MRKHDVWLYLSGELSPSEAEWFEAHLGDCPECRRRLGQAQRLDAAYRDVRSPEPGEIAIRRWMERFGPVASGKASERGWMAAAIALAAMIILAFSPWRSQTPPGDRLDLSWDGGNREIFALDQDLSAFGMIWTTPASDDDVHDHIKPVRWDVELLDRIDPISGERSGGGG